MLLYNINLHMFCTSLSDCRTDCGDWATQIIWMFFFRMKKECPTSEAYRVTRLNIEALKACKGSGYSMWVQVSTHQTNMEKETM